MVSNNDNIRRRDVRPGPAQRAEEIKRSPRRGAGRQPGECFKCRPRSTKDLCGSARKRAVLNQNGCCKRTRPSLAGTPRCQTCEDASREGVRVVPYRAFIGRGSHRWPFDYSGGLLIWQDQSAFQRQWHRHSVGVHSQVRFRVTDCHRARCAAQSFAEH